MARALVLKLLHALRVTSPRNTFTHPRARRTNLIAARKRKATPNYDNESYFRVEQSREKSLFLKDFPPGQIGTFVSDLSPFFF